MGVSPSPAAAQQLPPLCLCSQPPRRSPFVVAAPLVASGYAPLAAAGDAPLAIAGDSQRHAQRCSWQPRRSQPQAAHRS